MSYETICYRNACLSQVIIRVDFLEFVETEKLFNAEIEKEILNFLPKKGMKQIVRFQTMNVINDQTGTRAEHTTLEGIQQEYSNTDGNKIILSNKFIILEINKYSKYEDVIAMITPVLKSITDNIELISTRTGIRYINFFNEDSIKPQKNFFTANIGSLLENKQNIKDCIRSMAMNEYIVEDMHLNFRYGMYNPQYPQVIKKSHYVLDYDCFCDEAMEGYEKIVLHIHKGHDNIQRLFEESITPQLRKVME